ncbi:MAG: Uma2 family endonuclease [Synechococcaceae cyanobacterium SM2_3_1]|nr:Uma2 family endonuclease [Synechococcaceae cyanobacterium SM2_3_1]
MVISLNRNFDGTEIIYPCEDGEPLAESYEHLQVLIATFYILTAYLKGQQAVVLSDQFLYYVEGRPSARVAPDVMVIFNVAPGGRGNYKIWEEGEVPSVIFEMTSESTRERDWGFKKNLYEQLGVQEYWLFDPKGEWISEQLQGYRLDAEGVYRRIQDRYSQVLQLRLVVEGELIGFYRQDTNERLWPPNEFSAALDQEKQRADQEKQRADQEKQRADQEKQRADQEKQRADQLAERLRSLGIDPGEL